MKPDTVKVSALFKGSTLSFLILQKHGMMMKLSKEDYEEIKQTLRGKRFAYHTALEPGKYTPKETIFFNHEKKQKGTK